MKWIIRGPRLLVRRNRDDEGVVDQLDPPEILLRLFVEHHPVGEAPDLDGAAALGSEEVLAVAGHGDVAEETFRIENNGFVKVCSCVSASITSLSKNQNVATCHVVFTCI